MGRKTITWDQEELSRPSKYIIAVCDNNLDTQIIDTEEANNYMEKYERRAIIISNKEVFKNSNLDQIKFNFIMNATSPAVRLIDPSGRGYKEVYSYILDKFKNGLIIAHSDTMTNEIANEMAISKGNGLDFVVYRQDLLSLTGNERMRMNYLRIHFNPEFYFNKEYFNNFSEVYTTQAAIGIFTSQYIANAQQNICRNHFTEHSEIFEKNGYKDYIDYYELNKQFAWHVYYDVMANKILNIHVDKIKYYMELMFRAIDNKPLANRVDELSKIYAEL